MPNHPLKGTGVAIVTPFDKDLNIDYSAFERLIDHVISGGVDFIVAMGTTGEAPTLSASEKVELLNFVLRHVAGRCLVLTGHIAGNNTAEMIRSMKEVDTTGLFAFMISTPPYNKPNQRGLSAHFQALADASSLPILLYNVPGRTSVNLSIDTIINLAQNEKIIGIKEASGDLIRFTELLSQRPEGFAILSGDDPMALAQTSIGGDGVISVIANAFPGTFSGIIKDALSGSLENAQKANLQLWPFHEHLYSEGNPVGIKSLLSLMHFSSELVRLPLASMSDKGRKALGDVLEKYRSELAQS